LLPLASFSRDSMDMAGPNSISSIWISPGLTIAKSLSAYFIKEFIPKLISKNPYLSLLILSFFNNVLL
jgi:hypothetical protein